MKLITDLSEDLELTDLWLLNLDSFIPCHSQQDCVTPFYYPRHKQNTGKLYLLQLLCP